MIQQWQTNNYLSGVGVQVSVKPISVYYLEVSNFGAQAYLQLINGTNPPTNGQSITTDDRVFVLPAGSTVEKTVLNLGAFGYALRAGCFMAVSSTAKAYTPVTNPNDFLITLGIN